MEDQLAGFARILARARVQQQQEKRLFGKPRVRLGQCIFLGAYFFKLGGVLGARHSDKLDAFGPAFLGVKGVAGAVGTFFADVASSMEARDLDESTTFYDYVTLDSIRRFEYSGDAVGFFRAFAMKQVKLESGADFAWQFAESGAALGAIHPEIIRRMFERSQVPADKWQAARAAGLTIPAQQDVLSYDVVEQSEDALFMTYCRECCPGYHALLVS